MMESARAFWIRLKHLYCNQHMNPEKSEESFLLTSGGLHFLLLNDRTVFHLLAE